MMLDFVAGLPNKSLDDLTAEDTAHPSKPRVPDPANPGKFLSSSDVLKKLNEIDTNIRARSSINSDEQAFVRLMRDRLNGLVNPASGLSIAYTSLVVGSRRGSLGRTRYEFAHGAYPGLSGTARRHRWGQRALLALALFMTTTAVWESTKVTLGKALLNNVQQLHAQSAQNAVEKKTLESSSTQQAGWAAPIIKVAQEEGVYFDICNRPAFQTELLAEKHPGLRWPTETDQKTLMLVWESPTQHEFCGRDTVLAKRFETSRRDLQDFRTDWPKMVGAFFKELEEYGDIALGAAHGLAKFPSAVAGVTYAQWSCPTCRVSLPRGDAFPANGGGSPDQVHDIELQIAPVLMVLGNYVLPTIFALLGAAAFVVLDFYSKIRSSLLTPSDHVLSWIRLVLGLVVGACIGLFYSSYGPQQVESAKDLTGALTLSASGLAFLAGFGVEAVFYLLDALVKKVFGPKQGVA